MSKNKTRELIRSLSVFEQKAFRSYLDSSFFNCSTHEKKLFELLLRDIKKPETDKTTIYREINPGKNFDDKHFRYIQSGLNKHLINFFILRQIEKDPVTAASLGSRTLAD